MKILRLSDSGAEDARFLSCPAPRRGLRGAPGRRLKHPTAAAAGYSAGLLGGQRGAAAVGVLLSISVGLLFTLTLVNALLMLYGRAALQHAADAGARAGGRAEQGREAAACREAAGRAVADLAALYVNRVSIACRPATGGGGLVAAALRADLPPVFAGLGPSWRFTVRSSSVRERLQ